MTDTTALDPIERFRQWQDSLPYERDDMERVAANLATASKEGIPSLRVVLVKQYDARGFVFYTNMKSHKSHDLTENPQACLNFCWIKQSKQIRITGRVERVTDAEADAYFAARPYISRIGAWASAQSMLLESRDILMKKVGELQQQYPESSPPPRPPHWSGWRVVPEEIEFWQEGSHRLHDRDLYTRTPEGWSVHKLYP